LKYLIYYYLWCIIW